MQRIAAPLFLLALAAAPPALAAPSAIDALDATADEDGRVNATVVVSAVSPLGNGLAYVEASWQGRPLVGLIDEEGIGPVIGRVKIEGTVVSARGIGAFAGIAAVTDGTSNTIMLLAPGDRLPVTDAYTTLFTDILVSSVTLHDTDHRLVTTAAGTPFAAAVLRGPLPRTASVLHTPLGPVGVTSDARGIIAILIGL